MRQRERGGYRESGGHGIETVGMRLEWRSL